MVITVKRTERRKYLSDAVLEEGAAPEGLKVRMGLVAYGIGNDRLARDLYPTAYLYRETGRFLRIFPRRETVAQVLWMPEGKGVDYIIRVLPNHSSENEVAKRIAERLELNGYRMAIEIE